MLVGRYLLLRQEISTYDQHAEELVARERDLDTAITSVSQQVVLAFVTRMALHFIASFVTYSLGSQVVSFDARLGPLRAQIERQRSVRGNGYEECCWTGCVSLRVDRRCLHSSNSWLGSTNHPS